jgi:hypothetical protein
MKQKMLKCASVAALLISSVSAQAGTSIWKYDDPGSYMDKDTYVGGWNLNGASSEERKYTGPWMQCPPPPNRQNCPVSHTETHTIGWMLATSFALQINAGIKDFGSVQSTVTTTYTKSISDAYADNLGWTLTPGQTAQFISYVPRRYGSASLKGVMVDTGRQENRRKTTCGPRGCHTTYHVYHYYEWQSGTYGGVISGHKNTRTEPIWTWRLG